MAKIKNQRRKIQVKMKAKISFVNGMKMIDLYQITHQINNHYLIELVIIIRMKSSCQYKYAENGKYLYLINIKM